MSLSAVVFGLPPVCADCENALLAARKHVNPAHTARHRENWAMSRHLHPLAAGASRSLGTARAFGAGRGQRSAAPEVLNELGARERLRLWAAAPAPIPEF